MTHRLARTPHSEHFHVDLYKYRLDLHQFEYPVVSKFNIGWSSVSIEMSYRIYVAAVALAVTAYLVKVRNHIFHSVYVIATIDIEIGLINELSISNL